MLCIIVVIGISALVFVICLTRKRKCLTFRSGNRTVHVCVIVQLILMLNC